MELLKKYIHMNQCKNKASTQLTLDDDFIVPDTMDDVDRVLLDAGEIKSSSKVSWVEALDRRAHV